MAEDTDTDTETEVKEKKPRISIRWECPKCDNGITLHFKAKYPPVCSSTKHSTTGAILMEQKK